MIGFPLHQAGKVHIRLVLSLLLAILCGSLQAQKCKCPKEFENREPIEVFEFGKKQFIMLCGGEKDSVDGEVRYRSTQLFSLKGKQAIARYMSGRPVRIRKLNQELICTEFIYLPAGPDGKWEQQAYQVGFGHFEDNAFIWEKPVQVLNPPSLKTEVRNEYMGRINSLLFQGSKSGGDTLAAWLLILSLEEAPDALPMLQRAGTGFRPPKEAPIWNSVNSIYNRSLREPGKARLDSSMLGIEYLMPASVSKVFGQEIERQYIREDDGLPSWQILNTENNQMLSLQKRLYADDDQVINFRVEGFSQPLNFGKTALRSNYKYFISGQGIQIGMYPEEVVARLGKPKSWSKRGEFREILFYNKEDPELSFIRESGAKGYTANYRFKDSKLQSFEFGLVY